MLQDTYNAYKIFFKKYPNKNQPTNPRHPPAVKAQAHSMTCQGSTTAAAPHAQQRQLRCGRKDREAGSFQGQGIPLKA